MMRAVHRHRDTRWFKFGGRYYSYYTSTTIHTFNAGAADEAPWHAGLCLAADTTHTTLVVLIVLLVHHCILLYIPLMQVPLTAAVLVPVCRLIILLIVLIYILLLYAPLVKLGSALRALQRSRGRRGFLLC